MVLKELISNRSYCGNVVVLKELVFNSLLLEDLVVVKEIIFKTLGGCASLEKN